ncbi:MAG: hypothetical protein MUF82_02270 [Bacteroidetes bacterium]|jgi:hypothetical protein|nr:hypothetical protein [Bacteroidota bacterium]
MPSRVIIMAFFCLLLISSVHAQDPNAVREVILEHYARYPKMELQDLYKFLYQAAMGNEHLMNDTVGIRQYLSREMKSIKASAAEPLIERLSDDSSIVRLNLRPFKAMGGDERVLIEAMLRTAANFKKDPNALHIYWSAAETLAAEGAIPPTADSLRTFFAEQEAKGFPVFHHSDIFVAAYHPAYRLLMRAYLPR